MKGKILAKYENKHRNDEQELEELLKEREEMKEKRNTPPSPPVDPEEEETFKKRYGDLRRHAQKTEDELKEKLNALTQRLSDMDAQLKEERKKEKNKFPVTQEEFDEWAQQYPQTVKRLQTLIRKENEEVYTELENMKKRERVQEAWRIVLKKHKDGAEIVNLPEFKEWVTEKGGWVQRAVYSDDYDADAFIDVLSLWKNETGANKINKEDEEEKARKDADKARREAAETVSRSSSSSPDEVSNGSKKVWKESDIAKLHGRALERAWSEIEQARKEGRIEYDLTAGAR